MDAVQSEAVLRAAIQRARAEGLAIVTGTLGGRTVGCCCPLGALILDQSIPSEGPGARLDHVQRLMGWTNHQLSAFLRGFDHSRVESGPYQDLNQLGLSLRAELSPV